MHTTHLRTSKCWWGTEWRIRRPELEQIRRAKEIFFGWRPSIVISGVFKYFGRVFDKSDDDWTELYSNLAKAKN